VRTLLSIAVSMIGLQSTTVSFIVVKIHKRVWNFHNLPYHSQHGSETTEFQPYKILDKHSYQFVS
jgi:hypothetical protein